MKNLIDAMLAVLVGLLAVAALFGGMCLGYGLAGVFWGALILLITNVLLPLFDLHYELTLLQAFAAGIIVGIVRTVFSGLVVRSK